MIEDTDGLLVFPFFVRPSRVDDVARTKTNNEKANDKKRVPRGTLTLLDHIPMPTPLRHVISVQPSTQRVLKIPYKPPNHYFVENSFTNADFCPEQT